MLLPSVASGVTRSTCLSLCLQMQQLLNVQAWPPGLFEEDRASDPEPQKAMGSRLSRLKRSFMMRSSRGASAAGPSASSSTLAVRSDIYMGPMLDVPSSAFGGSGAGRRAGACLGDHSHHAVMSCMRKLAISHIMYSCVCASRRRYFSSRSSQGRWPKAVQWPASPHGCGQRHPGQQHTSSLERCPHNGQRWGELCF